VIDDGPSLPSTAAASTFLLDLRRRTGDGGVAPRPTDRWDLHVHLLDQTAQLGAILLRGRRRTILGRLTDDDVSAEPPPCGTPTSPSPTCRAVRSGSASSARSGSKLHHDRSRGPELSTTRCSRPAALRRPALGLGALDTLPAEKGHLYLDIGHVAGRPSGEGRPGPRDRRAGFVGSPRSSACKRCPRAHPGWTPDRRRAATRGPAPRRRSRRRRVTSRAVRPPAGRSRSAGSARWTARSRPSLRRRSSAAVVPTPFYDPEGLRLRA
jgi:hypothetical protein